MNNKKRILIALSTILIVVSTLPGCNKKLKVVKNNETKQEQLLGNVTREELKNYYIVETVLNNRRNLSLVDSKTINNMDSSLIQNIIPFIDIIDYYEIDKNSFTASDIEIILSNVEKDYFVISEQKIKKLK